MEIWSAEGAFLGLSHGPDANMATDLTPDIPSMGTNLVCVPAVQGFKVRIVYAHPIDAADRFASIKPKLRDLMYAAASLLDEAAQRGADRAKLRVACDAAGAIDIGHARLFTPARLASFSTIVTELRLAGFNDTRIKYLVFYDGEAPCACAGMANLEDDDRPGPENLNNGNSEQPMFAILFENSDATRTWLHELLHTLGAVQDSAPHSTGAGHCTDGHDIMCSYDGGPNAMNYTLGVCGADIVDCGNDDYFSAEPLENAYLARHWNLGSATNRFIEMERPWIHEMNCPAGARLGDVVSCTVAVTDDTPHVIVAVDWGAGSIDEQGSSDRESVLRFSHQYASEGNWSVSVAATNAYGATRIARTTTGVWDDSSPPEIEIFAPTAGRIYRGCNELAASAFEAIIAVQRLCIQLSARDAYSGIAALRVSLDDETFDLDPSKSVHELDLQTWGRQGPARLTIDATDAAGNEATLRLDVLLL